MQVTVRNPGLPGSEAVKMVAAVVCGLGADYEEVHDGKVWKAGDTELTLHEDGRIVFPMSVGPGDDPQAAERAAVYMIERVLKLRHTEMSMSPLDIVMGCLDIITGEAKKVDEKLAYALKGRSGDVYLPDKTRAAEVIRAFVQGVLEDANWLRPVSAVLSGFTPIDYHGRHQYA